MKKSLSVLAVLVSLILFNGCASSEDHFFSRAPQSSRSVAMAQSGAKRLTQRKTPAYKDAENKMLGSFITKYNPKSKARTTNITLAANSINDTLVVPGEIFSYNETIGPTTKEQGYKEARIFVRGKDAKGYGGGVCQVSSTLFNAADEAGMEIVERHTHSKKVGYVEAGRDATTSGNGNVDFKFQNNKEYPIVIKSSAQDGALSVSIEKA